MRPARDPRPAGRIVTIDGPAGTGKSATARGLSQRLRLRYLDSGALYRALAWAAERDGVLAAGDTRLAAWVAGLPVTVRTQPGSFQVLVAGHDVGREIRREEVGQAASRLATRAPVRDRVTALLREAARGRACVAEGRDMGSVVFPDARPKIFLTASLEARTARRVAQLRAAGLDADQERIRRELAERDWRDESRQISPLRAPVDAVRIDSSDLSLEEKTALVAAFYRGRGHYPGTRLFRWSQLLLRIFYLGLCGVRVSGRENIPTGACLLAANHRDSTDPTLVACLLPGAAAILAKAELFHGPLGALIRRYNAIPVRRGTADRQALRTAQRWLQLGVPLMIFPEGTRIRGGAMGAPHAGVAWLARRTGLPVVPVRLANGGLRRSLLRREPMWVRFGRPLAWEAPAGPGAPAHADAAFAARVMAAIAALDFPNSPAGRTLVS